MAIATAKTGRVTKLADVKGTMAYRFVPHDWPGPPSAFAQVTWYVFDPVKYADDYAKIKADMLGRRERLKTWCNEDWDGSVSWYNGGELWTAKVTYDEIERPVLILMGGL